MNTKRLGRIKLLHIHRGQSKTHGQMNRLSRTVIQLLQMRQTEPANVELPDGRLPERNASYSQMIIPSFVDRKKSGGLKIPEKAMQRAGRKSRELSKLRCAVGGIRPGKQGQQLQSALKSGD